MGVTRGEYTNNVLTFFDTVLSPPRGTSPWETFPMQALEDPGTGFCIYDDFFINNTTKTTDLWQIVKGTGGSVTLSSSLSMGWINIPTAASLHDYQSFWTEEPIFYFGKNVPVVWEASINVTEANTNKASWFAGLSSVTTTGFISNTGTTPASYSGAVIYKTEGGLNLNAQTSNGSTQNTTSSAITTVVSGQTYIIGMALNPNDGVTGIVTWYVSTVTSNARALITGGTGTLNLTLASLANMYFGFGINAASASAETLTLDYVQVAQGRYYQ